MPADAGAAAVVLMLELLAARIAWMEWQKCPFINFGRVCFHGSLARLVEPQGPLGCYFKFVLLQTVWGIVDSTYHHIACRLPTLAVMATEFIQGFCILNMLDDQFATTFHGFAEHHVTK